MKRHFYQKLLQWKSSKPRKPLILKGVRQCGKTFLLQEFGNAEFKKVHYINFEKMPNLEQIFTQNLDPKRILNEISFHLDTAIDTQHDVLIFDEIQACPVALTSLKYFCEEIPELAICAAGSLLGVYLGPASFPVGKVIIYHFYPMSFAEFLLAIGDEKSYLFLEHCHQNQVTSTLIHQHIWERLKWYFIVGGLPEVVETFAQTYQHNLFAAFESVREKQDQLIKAYYADIAKHSGKVNALHIDRVLRAIPSQLSSTQDGSAHKFQFKEIIPGVDRYQRLAGAIDWLIAAGLALKVPVVHTAQFPLSAYTRENCFKLLVFDVGIFGALSHLPPKIILNYDYGTYKGYFAENFVAQELFWTDEDNLYSWQEKKAEVEFLRIVNDTIIPIEVKSGWITKAKSLQKFVEKYVPPYRTIMSAHPLNIDTRNQIHHYPLYLAYRFPIFCK